MNKPLISVIIPVYNIANYLPKCLDSVLSQTYSSLEVIVVDDGSTDDSVLVIHNYARLDARIIPITQTNGGVSKARNTGLEAAHGDYVFFLDGDDWLEYDALERLHSFSYIFDIVQGLHVQSDKNGKEQLLLDVPERALDSTEEILSFYFVNQIQESCCNKLYKRAVIGNTQFDTTLAVAEDSQFVYTVLKKANNVMLLSDITYHYCFREDSCVHTALSERHFDVLKVRDRQREEIQDNPRLFNKYVCKYALDVVHLIGCILRDPRWKRCDRLMELRFKILEIKVFIFKCEDLSLKFKLGVLLLWWAPRVFYAIYPKVLEKS